MARRFTLVELMIVVAIIAILAALGMESFRTLQLRSKRAEASVNVKAIGLTQQVWATSFDEYATAAGPGTETLPRPTADLDKKAEPWVGGTQFDRMGWSPNSEVRCGYMTLGSDPGIGCPAGDVSVYARCDVDDDDVIYAFVVCANPHDLRWSELPRDETEY